MPQAGQYSGEPLSSRQQSKSVGFNLGRRFHNIIYAAAGFHGNRELTGSGQERGR